MTDTFAFPVADALPDPPLLTWIPPGGFKTHNSLATAKTRLSRTRDRNGKFRGGVLYRVVESRWVPFVVVRPGTSQQDYLLWANPKKWARAPGITVLLTENPYT